MTCRTLVVFDIDGTLCDTCAVDEECFLRAVGESLDLDLRSVDWSSAPHVTDAGILNWLWQRHLGRSARPAEISAVSARFMVFLGEAYGCSPERFRAIPGARELIRTADGGSLRFTVATGGWECSARMKLASAGFHPGIVGASSTDSADRVAVFRLAAERARKSSWDFDSVVLVGDGVWDTKVARTLGWRFVGVATSDRADSLYREGARALIGDFTSVASLEDLASMSQAPCSPDKPEG